MIMMVIMVMIMMMIMIKFMMAIIIIMMRMMMSCGWDFRISCGSIIQNWVNHYSFAITMLVVIILNVSWC